MLKKSTQKYQAERQTSLEHEQKPVKFDDFNNEEEKIIKEWEKKKKKARGSWEKLGTKETKKAETEKI